jgi:hypothetical protein
MRILAQFPGYAGCSPRSIRPSMYYVYFHTEREHALTYTGATE